MKRARVIFHGRVQGVFFRANCQKKAVEIGVKGWVRNIPDGTVESIMEGDENSLNDLIEWCSKKQPLARVSYVEVSWEPPVETEGTFMIRY